MKLKLSGKGIFTKKDSSLRYKSDKEVIISQQGLSTLRRIEQDYGDGPDIIRLTFSRCSD